MIAICSKYIPIILLILLSYNHVSGQSESELKDKLKQSKNVIEEFQSILDLGQYYIKYNLKRADSIKFNIIEKSKPLGPDEKFQALSLVSNIELRRGNFNESDRYLLASQQFLTALKSESNKNELLYLLGKHHVFQAEYDAARFYLVQAAQQSVESQNHKLSTLSYLGLSKYYEVTSDKDSALLFIKKAITSARKSKQRELLAIVFNKQAELYSSYDQLDLSLAKNIVALQISEEINSKYLTTNILREVAELQFKSNNLSDAEQYIKKSIQFSQDIHNKYQEGLGLILLVKVEISKNNLDSALKINALADTIFTTSRNRNSQAAIMANFGAISNLKKDYKESIQYFNKALVLYENAKNKKEISETYTEIGKVFNKTKQYKKAINYLKKSIDIRKETNTYIQNPVTYKTISEIYSNINQPKKALEYLNYYISYLDSNTSFQSQTNMAELSERYKSEQREKLIRQQKDSLQTVANERTLTNSKLENSQLKNNLQTYILIAVLLLIIMAAILIRNKWKNENIKQRQREMELSQSLLRTQMNPHFVFNAMSVIQSYIYDNDTLNSSRFLVNFSRLMRLILENSPKKFITLETEINILEKYLAVQAMRFQDRFEFEIICSHSISANDTLIPPMITQPFVENAIEHGQLHTLLNGFIRIEFSIKNDMLNVLIIDNGIGIENSKKDKKASTHKSMAMQITQDRIDILNSKYKEDSNISIEHYDQIKRSGTKITLSLPYKTTTD